MNNIHIEDSYKVWSKREMNYLCSRYSWEEAKELFPTDYLNRSWRSIHIEWWMHNIGYYITLPFIAVDWVKKINIRCKDVDLQEWGAGNG